ncbi:MAG TPA: alpha/beta hydrolase [Novosphingobium sp.]|nr:alpha/beta hydrolase [Novosphingobium sp.]
MSASVQNNWPRRGYADGPFGQVHYQVLGEGAPLVLLHQAPMTSGQFDWVYEPLARRGICAIGIDMPGFGGSDPAPGVPRVEDYGQCVVPVLDALGIAQAAVLGHHTGSMAATEAALQNPGRISAVILNGPMPLSAQERESFMANGHKRERDLVAVSGGAHFNEIFAARERLAAGSLPMERIGQFVVQALSGRGEYWHGHHAAYQYRHEDSLPLIRQRALILTNTGDMIYGHAKRAHEIRPDLPFVALEGGGVDIVDQHSEAWAEVVAEFVKNG